MPALCSSMRTVVTLALIFLLFLKTDQERNPKVNKSALLSHFQCFLVSGKLCGSVGKLNPLSSCKSGVDSDDVESLVVMPGCKLEVWDHDDGLSKQLDAEKDGPNDGARRTAKDQYKKNLLVLYGADPQTPNWINELDDDFDDLNEDIDSFRCTCN